MYRTAPNVRYQPIQPKFYQENYVVPKDNTTEYIILALILFIVVGFWVIVFYYAKDKDIANPTTQNLKGANDVAGKGFGDLYGSDKSGQEYGTLTVYEQCPVGYCPTNMQTGEKRCPTNASLQILYNPATEVCNPQYSCNATATPYAIQFDGSVDLAGQCEPGIECRCTNTLYAPSYVQSLFNVQNGSILTTNPDNINKYYLSQTPAQTNGQGILNPITYNDPINQFYEITSGFLPQIYPNPCESIINNFITPSNPDVDLDVTNTLACVNTNPCLQGKMAYLMAYNSNFTQFDVYGNFNNIPLGCVPDLVENPTYTKIGSTITSVSNACQSYQAPVFNYITGKIHCVNSNPVFNLSALTGLNVSVSKVNPAAPPPYIEISNIPITFVPYLSFEIDQTTGSFQLSTIASLGSMVQGGNTITYQWVKLDSISGNLSKLSDGSFSYGTITNSLTSIMTVSGISSLSSGVYGCLVTNKPSADTQNVSSTILTDLVNIIVV